MLDQLALGDEELSAWVRKSKTIDSVTRLPGDASTRRYYRIEAGGRPYVVMRMEPLGSENGQSRRPGMRGLWRDCVGKALSVTASRKFTPFSRFLDGI